MPVVLMPADYDAWLSGGVEDAAGLLKPCDEDLLEVFAEGVGLKAEG